MKKVFILPFLLCLLLSACTLDKRINMQSSENVIYDTNIKDDIEDNTEEDISDNSTQTKEVQQSDISSISFTDLSEKDKKRLSKQLGDIFANYYCVDSKEFDSDLLLQKLEDIANYGLVYKENDKAYLNEQAIIDLIDIFTEDLVMNSSKEN